MNSQDLLDQLAIHAPPAPAAWTNDRGLRCSNTDAHDIAEWPYHFARSAVLHRVVYRPLRQITVNGQPGQVENALCTRGSGRS